MLITLELCNKVKNQDLILIYMGNSKLRIIQKMEKLWLIIMCTYLQTKVTPQSI